MRQHMDVTMAPPHARAHLARTLIAAALFAVLPTAGRAGAGEPVLVVNTTDATRDTICDAHCSLADAISTANREPAVTAIHFAIPASDPGCDAAGVCTIRPVEPTEELIATGVTIDGFSQPGAAANTAPFGEPIAAAMKVVLDGVLLPCCSNGVVLRGTGNRVRGLVIRRFYTGIYVRDGSDARIDGVFIGTDPTGTTAFGNTCSGISVAGDEGGAGSPGAVIGGPAPEHRNLVSGNGCVGIELGPSGTGQVQGNYVGTDASGLAALPNERDGIYVYSTSADNLIGGEAPEAANLIAFNADAGVRVSGGGAVRNTISRNRIRENGAPGIVLVSGGNGDLAAPQISAASPTAVNGTACAGCAIEVFSTADDEGGTYEGTVIAGGAGGWRLQQPAGFTGPNLTATATDALGNTSAFSAPASILQTATATPSATSPPPTPSASATHTPPPSATSSRTATPTASATASTTAGRTSTASASPTTPSISPSPSPGECPGDCDGDGTVTIDELVRSVGIALGSQPLGACRPADRDGDGRVTIDELVAAVGAALGRC